jgi:hypothetical protein
MVDARKALRDVLEGIGMPAKWMRDEASMEQIDAQRQQKQEQMEMMAAMEQGGKAAANMGKAAKEVSEVQG